MTAETFKLLAAGLCMGLGAIGPGIGIGILASGKYTNEENYLMQKFMRAAIGTNNIDHCARL